VIALAAGGSDPILTALAAWGLGFIGVLVVALAVGALAVMWSRPRFVRRSSARLAALRQVNQRYQGRAQTISPVTLSHVTPGLRQFRAVNAELVAQERRSEWEHLGALTQANSAALRAYQGEVAAAVNQPFGVPKLPWYLSTNGYAQIERRELVKLTLWFQTDCAVKVVWTYTSPQGRNRYRLERTFTRDDLVRLTEQQTQQQTERQRYQATAEYERALMTPALRVDILRRDGNRCVMCGASARDGAKLHIDHIQPVSRGGKTVPGNLQTLCSRCNLGKSNRFTG
jgi:5-methylcytosine-specific restriction endonuclease McrA